jgi:hypothetical protein
LDSLTCHEIRHLLTTVLIADPRHHPPATPRSAWRHNTNTAPDRATASDKLNREILG